MRTISRPLTLELKLYIHDFFFASNNVQIYFRPAETTSALSPSNLPVSSTELQLFNDIPANKLTQPQIVSLQSNPSIYINRFKNEPTLEILLNHLLTAKGVENELQVVTKFHNALFEKCNDLQLVQLKQTEGKFFVILIDHISDDDLFNFNLTLFTVDMNDINHSFSDQHEIIRELIDQITIINEITQQTLDKCQKYSNFFLKNPLNKYVPTSITFEGCTYQALENEFMLYNRILKREDSRK